VRVLPWATTYRHLVYGAHPDELLPGERVNLFFNPDDKQKRGYLVHFQDELCQMKGHGHNWQVESVATNGRAFTARAMADKKPLDDKTLSFHLDDKSRQWRAGKRVEMPSLRPSERLYMTWVYHDSRRVVHLTADDESLNALKKIEEQAVTRRLAAEGLSARVEKVEGDVAHLLVFPTYWSQAALWKVGQTVQIRATGAGFRPVGEPITANLLSRKNLGTYGSGATEVSVRLARPAEVPRVKSLIGEKVVRIRAQ
jgi:hypothetical protein